MIGHQVSANNVDVSLRVWYKQRLQTLLDQFVVQLLQLVAQNRIDTFSVPCASAPLFGYGVRDTVYSPLLRRGACEHSRRRTANISIQASFNTNWMIIALNISLKHGLFLRFCTSKNVLV